MYSRKQYFIVRSLALSIAVILVPVMLLASTSGKIAGVVENEETGEPIPGATIRVVGTDIATQTDPDGEYYIINLPAGTYSLTVSVVGYASVEKENVRVLLDLTTPVDFTIEQVEIPLKSKIKVYAEQPPIQKDLTASRTTVTSEQIALIPNALSVQNIISNMAGTVVDRNSNLHVRGGRGGEVTYFYDGFSIQDPFVGRAGLRISPDAIEEVNLTSGGFPAEYGEALSGIVTAVSKEGGRSYHGKVKVYEGATYPYNVHKGEYASLTRTDIRGLSYNLSGPIPLGGRMNPTFFYAGEILRDDGYLPHNEQTAWTQTGKLRFMPTPNLKLTASGTYYYTEGQIYEHVNVNSRSYDYNLDGLGRHEGKAYLYGLKGDYQYSRNTFINFSYNRFHTERKVAPDSLFDVYWDQWPGYSVDSNGVYNGTIDDDNYNSTSDYFYTRYTYGDDFDPYYHKRSTSYDGFTLQYSSQFNKYNQLRVGGEYRKYELFWDDKQFYNLEPYGEKYSQKPVYGMFYVQDKIEMKNFIVNIGIRWDYLNSEVNYWPNVLDTVDYSMISSKSKSHFSPRLGISHPIAENTVIRFNYGYFYQIPNFSLMYTNLDANLNTGYPLIGNPDLKPEQTIAYELGLNHMLDDDIRLDMTVYYKDIKNLLATRRIGFHGLNPVTQYVNEDYGSVKGADLTIEKIATGNFSGSLVYSYMIAKGNSSSATEGYYVYITDPDVQDPNDPISNLPVKEYPLSFDQRHTATLTLSYRTPAEWKGEFFGIPVPGNWGLNVISKYGSGLPYTVTDNSGNHTGGVNEARMPAKYTVDMRFNKDFHLGRSKSLFMSFFVEVENLFNRRNVVSVYTNTGRPDYDGRYYDQTADPDGEGPYTAEDVNRYYRLLAKDPQNFSAPRTFRVGMEFNF